MSFASIGSDTLIDIFSLDFEYFDVAVFQLSVNLHNVEVDSAHFDITCD